MKLEKKDIGFALVCALGVSASVFVETNSPLKSLLVGLLFFIVELVMMIVAFST